MSYRVEIAADILQRIRELGREAITAGQGVELSSAARSLFGQLEVAPAGMGEPMDHTRIGDLVCVVVRGPLALNFVIHEEPPVVWVIKAERLLARQE